MRPKFRILGPYAGECPYTRPARIGMQVDRRAYVMLGACT